jgi:hypothetical protein
MHARTRYYVRLYQQRARRGLCVVDTTFAINEFSALNTARVASKDHDGAFAFSIDRDEVGNEVMAVVARYGQVADLN